MNETGKMFDSLASDPPNAFIIEGIAEVVTTESLLLQLPPTGLEWLLNWLFPDTTHRIKARVHNMYRGYQPPTMRVQRIEPL